MVADVVLLSIATYGAAVFPLTLDGVSDEEQEARRTVAYRLSAYDGLPHGFPFDRRTEPCPTDLRLSASAALPGSWTR